MWRFVVLAVVIIAVLVAGFSLADVAGDGPVTASAVIGDVQLVTDGFDRVEMPRTWSFPADYGAHPDYQTEWWYYTGNLEDATGRPFGYQFTVFRRAITPESYASESEWRTSQIYMAHLTLSDLQTGRFYHDERYSRGGAELAGATVEPVYRVWLEDWQVQAQDAAAEQTRITARSTDFALDLALTQTKPPALQGQQGLSPKSDTIGNASYYYSLTALETTGTLTLGDVVYTVTGDSWKDHEFGTQALADDVQGWDWFSLILADGREVMLGQIRLTSGALESAFGGLLVNTDGTTQYLASSDFTIMAQSNWTSPHTGTVYPAGWAVTVRLPDDEILQLTLAPRMADQELYESGIIYWEGAISIHGSISGYGYAELTGYAHPMSGRF